MKWALPTRLRHFPFSKVPFPKCMQFLVSFFFPPIRDRKSRPTVFSWNFLHLRHISFPKSTSRRSPDLWCATCVSNFWGSIAPDPQGKIENSRPRRHRPPAFRLSSDFSTFLAWTNVCLERESLGSTLAFQADSSPKNGGQKYFVFSKKNDLVLLNWFSYKNDVSDQSIKTEG